MTQSEMLQAQLAKAGWMITGETDEDGYAVCKAD